MNTWIGRAAVAAIVVLGAAKADAQITTVIDAPKRTDAKQQAAARRQEVAQDSVARVTMTGMKQWVDSAAAALALRPDTGAVAARDTAATSAANPTQPVAPNPDSAAATPARPAGQKPEFRDGARAPDTGTPVPTVALIGAIMVLIGGALRLRLTAAKARVAKR